MLLTTVTTINASKLAVGIASLTFNFGSRVILGDLTPSQQKFFRHPVVKRFVLVCMFFVVTRDVFVSIALALLTVLLMDVLLNESSRFCIMPGKKECPSNVVAALPGSVHEVGKKTQHLIPLRPISVVAATHE